MADDIKRHFDTVAEDLKGDIQQVAEGVTANTQQLERLEAMEATLDQVNLVELKEEVTDLRKRVEELESRVVK